LVGVPAKGPLYPGGLRRGGKEKKAKKQGGGRSKMQGEKHKGKEVEIKIS